MLAQLHQRGIDDLAAARQVTVLLQLLRNLFEDERAGTGLGQAAAEQTDRLGAGDAEAVGQVEELQEAMPVEQLILSASSARLS